jgi:hypothetical protein
MRSILAVPGDCQTCDGTCAAPSCSDGVTSGFESDVDCGRVCDERCATGLRCVDGFDCLSGNCSQGRCF